MSGRDAPCGKGRRGQALLEVALVLPVLLFLAFGVIAAGRVTQAKLGVSAVAREAARAAAQSGGAAEASRRGHSRAAEVADGYGLGDGSRVVLIDAGGVGPGELVRASASYEVGFGDLPLLGWARVRVASSSGERVDLYRSRWGERGAP